METYPLKTDNHKIIYLFHHYLMKEMYGNKKPENNFSAKKIQRENQREKELLKILPEETLKNRCPYEIEIKDIITNVIQDKLNYQKENQDKFFLARTVILSCFEFGRIDLLEWMEEAYPKQLSAILQNQFLSDENRKHFQLRILCDYFMNFSQKDIFTRSLFWLERNGFDFNYPSKIKMPNIFLSHLMKRFIHPPDFEFTNYKDDPGESKKTQIELLLFKAQILINHGLMLDTTDEDEKIFYKKRFLLYYINNLDTPEFTDFFLKQKIVTTFKQYKQLLEHVTRNTLDISFRQGGAYFDFQKIVANSRIESLLKFVLNEPPQIQEELLKDLKKDNAITKAIAVKLENMILDKENKNNIYNRKLIL